MKKTRDEMLAEWAVDPLNPRQHLTPLVKRIAAENPVWTMQRVLLEAKRRGTSKQLVSSDERGNLITGPNPDYIEPPSN